LDLGQYERAIQDLDQAIRLNPLLVLAYADRALAHTLVGRDAEAEKDIDKAVALGFDRALLEKEVEREKQLRQR
ncbi:MAG: tetratricopeptide repeat protein, partial [Candidatus Binatia bacterium]